MDLRDFIRKQRKIMANRYENSLAHQHDEFRRENRNYHELLYELECKKFKNESGIKVTKNIQLDSLKFLYWV